ncbi:DUF6444 domain-containing protein [Nostocoides japonicum]|uniref:DUF6444 domain-containing protein n=1 Tax=Nostocoides japonicum TaxID=99481 RepID=UPI001F33990A
MPAASLEDVLATIAALEARVRELEAENVGLRRRLGMGSGNSSKPPSTDGPDKAPPTSCGRRPAAGRGEASPCRGPVGAGRRPGREGRTPSERVRRVRRGTRPGRAGVGAPVSVRRCCGRYSTCRRWRWR